MSSNRIGYIHSIETLGTHDGPGLRCVFFLAGCNFQCTFCQNRDTWSIKSGKPMTIEQVEEKLLPLLPYLKKGNGGVTLSGGEPTVQPEFVIAVFELAHQLGLSTALDTNGMCPVKYRNKILALCDLAMLDIKACDSKLHQQITGCGNQTVLEFGRLAAEKEGRLLLRRVLLPTINNSADEMNALADYALSLDYQPQIELISYHRLGVHKWEGLNIPYPLERLKPPTERQWQQAADYLKKRGLTVTRG